jgi:hypothetical protein
MGYWNNTDREESKPTWLNPAQKINCVRTVAGWELPLDGTSLGGQQAGKLGTTASAPFMELLVCLPIDPSITGVTATNYAGRLVATGGSTAGTDTPNYRPFFTCPFSGDSATAGGFDGSGLSFATSSTGVAPAVGNYAVNGYGVSTLNFPASATAYIKVVANDTNFTNDLTFSEITDPFGTRGNIVQGANLLTASNVPTAIYENFFGPTSAFNNNIAVFKIDRLGTTAGSYNVTLRVTDNGAGSLTGDTSFRVTFV